MQDTDGESRQNEETLAFNGVNTQIDQGVNHVGIMPLASQMNLFLL